MSWLTKLRSGREPASAQAQAATKPPTSVADAFLESYVSWREACEDVRDAYERWTNCTPRQRPLAFRGYRVALDREEDIARAHSDLAERLRALTRLPRSE